MRHAVFALFLLLAPVVLHAETVDLGDHGTFRMDMPEGWKMEVTRSGNFNVELILNAPSGIVEKGKITLLLSDQPMLQTDKEKIEGMLNAMGGALLPHSLEKTITPVSFGLSKGYGAYSIFTDAKLVGQPPKPGDWKVAAMGILGLSPDVMGSVSLFTDNPKSPEFAAMLKAVSTATVTKKEAPATQVGMR